MLGNFQQFCLSSQSGVAIISWFSDIFSYLHVRSADIYLHCEDTGEKKWYAIRTTAWVDQTLQVERQQTRNNKIKYFYYLAIYIILKIKKLRGKMSSIWLMLNRNRL